MGRITGVLLQGRNILSVTGRWRTSLTLLLLGFSLAQVSLCTELVSRSTQLPALAINQNELRDLVLNIDSVVLSANTSDQDCRAESPTVKVSDGSSDIEFAAGQIGDELSRFPAPAFGLTISYYCRSDTAPVKSISLDLSDSFRQLMVRGAQPGQVDSVYSMISLDLQRHSKLLAGSRARFGICALLFVCCVLVGSYLGDLAKKSENKVQAWGATIVMLGLIVIAACSPLLADVLAPFIPGFAIYSGDVSFIRRYSAEIGFISVLCTFLAGLLRWLWKQFGEHPITQQPTARSADASSSSVDGGGI